MSLYVRIATAALFAAAGLSLFVMLLNRVLILIKDGPDKTRSIALHFVALTVGPAVVGFFVGWSWWAAMPVAVLSLVAVGEIRRLIIRRRCRADPPAEVTRARAGLRVVTTTDLAVRRYNLACEKWRGPDFRIAHFSDLHLHDRMDAAYFARAMEQVNKTDPDLVFMTGDFITRLEFAARLPELLGSVKGRLGVFAVLGNHDHWSGGAEVGQAVEKAGVELLGNGCRRVGIKGEQSVMVCGCEDPWGDKPFEPPSVSADDVMLVLTHTPDNIYRLNRAGAAAVFAGHCHAGQVKVPPVGSVVVPSVYGRRFDHGHFKVDGTDLFVTAGIGTVGPTLRMFCEPDIFVVDIKNPEND